MMPQTLTQRCTDLIGELGIARRDEVVDVRPLTGGVASDIAVVAMPGRDVVVKFALEKLKVSEDWHAPVHRNKAEYAWLKFAHETCPRNAPEIFGRSDGLQGFAMEFLRGDDVYLWKSALLAEEPSKGVARKVGRLLGRLHAASAASTFDRTPFDNRDDFRALRLEPYLTFTATRHRYLAEWFQGLSEALYASDQVLVHGDVSPKNILVRDGEPVLLDAECATMGDASFDLAFCLNHLILKTIHLPASRNRLFGEALALWEAYSTHVNWEPVADLEARTVALLPALMLARADGKSPVEYLDEGNRHLVRALSIPRVTNPLPTLAAFIDSLKEEASLK